MAKAGAQKIHQIVSFHGILEAMQVSRVFYFEFTFVPVPGGQEV